MNKKATKRISLKEKLENLSSRMKSPVTIESSTTVIKETDYLIEKASHQIDDYSRDILSRFKPKGTWVDKAVEDYLNADSLCTMADIGREYGISRERVRQILEKELGNDTINELKNLKRIKRTLMNTKKKEQNRVAPKGTVKYTYINTNHIKYNNNDFYRIYSDGKPTIYFYCVETGEKITARRGINFCEGIFTPYDNRKNIKEFTRTKLAKSFNSEKEIFDYVFRVR